MDERQREVAELAAKLLAGMIAGATSKPNMDLNHIGPQHIAGSVRMALWLIEEVKKAVPPR